MQGQPLTENSHFLHEKGKGGKKAHRQKCSGEEGLIFGCNFLIFFFVDKKALISMSRLLILVDCPYIYLT